MPTVEKTRRRSSRPVATDTVQQMTPAQFANALAYLAARRQAGDFQLLGRMDQILTEQGEIRFPHSSGPLIGAGVEKQGAVKPYHVLISDWVPLPDLRENTEEFCPDCLAQCIICAGKNKIPCTAAGCGGAGQIAVGSLPCPNCVVRTGRFAPSCIRCHGTGAVPRLEVCKTCLGTARMICNGCRGTGKQPTGYQGGSRERSAQTCSTCLGWLRKGQIIPQDWHKFLHRTQFPDGRWYGYAVLGPLHSFWLVSVMPTEPVRSRVMQVRPDAAGNAMVLLVKDPELPGSEAYLLGGVLQVLK